MSAEAKVIGLRFTGFVIASQKSSKVEDVIYVPSYRLEFSSGGSIRMAEERSATLAALQASWEILQNNSRGNAPALKHHQIVPIMRDAQDEVDLDAVEAVELSKDLLDQIKKLLENSSNAVSKQEEAPEIKQKIQVLISSLFGKR